MEKRFATVEKHVSAVDKNFGTVEKNFVERRSGRTLSFSLGRGDMEACIMVIKRGNASDLTVGPSGLV
jgi:hypothetical protein